MCISTLLAAIAAFALPASAQDAPPKILRKNCNVFDGVAESLAEGRNVIVEGKRIAAIGDPALSAEDATEIDCSGRTLTRPKTSRNSRVGKITLIS